MPRMFHSPSSFRRVCRAVTGISIESLKSIRRWGTVTVDSICPSALRSGHAGDGDICPRSHTGRGLPRARRADHLCPVPNGESDVISSPLQSTMPVQASRAVFRQLCIAGRHQQPLRLSFRTPVVLSSVRQSFGFSSTTPFKMGQSDVQNAWIGSAGPGAFDLRSRES